MANAIESPYIKIWGESGKEVTDNVTSFVYVHSEESDDECVIIISEPYAIDLPDRLDFQPEKPLKVQWGYIGGASQTRTIIIIDIEGNYNEKGTNLTIKGYDKAFYLKHTRTLSTEQGILISPNLETVLEKVAEANGLTYKPLTLAESIQQDRLLRPLEYDFHGDYVKPGAIGGAASIPSKFIPDQQVIAGQTDFQVVKSLAEKQGANINIIGRDGEVGIEYRNFTQKPIKEYMYGDAFGLILNFKPELKNRKAKSAASSVTYKYNDPTNKEALSKSGTTDISKSKDAHLGDGQNKDRKPLVGGSLTKPQGPFTQADIYYNPKLTTPQDNLPSPTGDSFLVLVQDDYSGQVEVGHMYSTPIAEKEISTPVTDEVEAQLLAERDRLEALIKQNMGSMEVVGDPTLVSSKIVTVLNVSEKYSGNWYIVKATHTIQSSQAYTVKLDISRNALSNKAIGEMISAKEKGLQLNREIQEEREVDAEITRRLKEKKEQ